MGRISNAEVHRSFKLLPGGPGRISQKAKCNHCGGYNKVANITYQKAHLLTDCRPYMRKLATTTPSNGGDDDIAQAAKIRQQERLPSMMNQAAAAGSADVLEIITQAAAELIFFEGLPFSFLEKPAMRRLMKILRPNWEPTSRTTITKHLLPETYDQLKNRVIAQLSMQDNLAVVYDASSDITGNRMVSISIGYQGGPCFFIDMVDTSDDRHTAGQMGDLFKSTIGPFINYEWGRVNSLTTDTCNSAIASQQYLQKDPSLGHVFGVRCDSHGLHLLAKDLLKIPHLAHCFSTAESIVIFFHRSTLQLGRLRKHQLEKYGKHYALLTA